MNDTLINDLGLMMHWARVSIYHAAGMSDIARVHRFVLFYEELKDFYDDLVSREK